MVRVLVPCLVAISLSGCGLGSSSLTAGFADSGQPTSTLPPSRSRGGPDLALNDTPAPPRKTEDRAPRGTYERAPAGALADRDYTVTALEPEKARDLINAYRKQNGLKPLRLNVALTEAAKAHSRDLAKWDRISHFGSDGSNPWDRVKRSGFNAKVAAENVGTGQATIAEVLKGWQTSPGHNKNLLLPDADQMGIALVQDPKTEFKTFWTLVVGASL